MKLDFTQYDGFDGPAFVKPKPGTLRTDAEIAKWAWETVREIQGSLDRNDRGSQLASFLIASSLIGADENRICLTLGLDPRLGALWARNLRKNNLWSADGAVIDEHWFDDDIGYFNFCMTGLVAMGLVKFGGFGRFPRSN